MFARARGLLALAVALACDREAEAWPGRVLGAAGAPTWPPNVTVHVVTSNGAELLVSYGGPDAVAVAGYYVTSTVASSSPVGVVGTAAGPALWFNLSGTPAHRATSLNVMLTRPGAAIALAVAAVGVSGGTVGPQTVVVALSCDVGTLAVAADGGSGAQCVACPLPSGCNGTELCVPGTSGALCTSCGSRLYRPAGSLACTACPEGSVWWPVGISAGLLVGVALLMARKQPFSLPLGVLRIVVDFAQLTMLAVQAMPSFPVVLSGARSSLTGVSVSLDMFRPECSAAAGDTNVHSQLHWWYAVVISGIGIPVTLAVAFLCTIVGTSLGLMSPASDVTTKIRRWILSLLLLIFQSAMQAYTAMFVCIEDATRYRELLLIDMSVECYSGTHLTMAVVSGVLLAVWVVLLLGGGSIMYRVRNTAKLEIPAVFRVFGALYWMFKRHSAWFAVAVAVRKLLCVMFLRGFPAHPIAGAAASTAVNLVYFIALVRMRPYVAMVRSIRACGHKGWADVLNMSDALLSGVCVLTYAVLLIDTAVSDGATPEVLTWLLVAIIAVSVVVLGTAVLAIRIRQRHTDANMRASGAELQAEVKRLEAAMLRAADARKFILAEEICMQVHVLRRRVDAGLGVPGATEDHGASSHTIGKRKIMGLGLAAATASMYAKKALLARKARSDAGEDATEADVNLDKLFDDAQPVRSGRTAGLKSLTRKLSRVEVAPIDVFGTAAVEHDIADPAPVKLAPTVTKAEDAHVSMSFLHAGEEVAAKTDEHEAEVADLSTAMFASLGGVTESPRDAFVGVMSHDTSVSAGSGPRAAGSESRRPTLPKPEPLIVSVSAALSQSPSVSASDTVPPGTTSGPTTTSPQHAAAVRVSPMARALTGNLKSFSKGVHLPGSASPRIVESQSVKPVAGSKSTESPQKSPKRGPRRSQTAYVGKWKAREDDKVADSGTRNNVGLFGFGSRGPQAGIKSVRVIPVSAASSSRMRSPRAPLRLLPPLGASTDSRADGSTKAGPQTLASNGGSKPSSLMDGMIEGAVEVEDDLDEEEHVKDEGVVRPPSPSWPEDLLAAVREARSKAAQGIAEEFARWTSAAKFDALRARSPAFLPCSTTRVQAAVEAMELTIQDNCDLCIEQAVFREWFGMAAEIDARYKVARTTALVALGNVAVQTVQAAIAGLLAAVSTGDGPAMRRVAVVADATVWTAAVAVGNAVANLATERRDAKALGVAVAGIRETAAPVAISNALCDILATVVEKAAAVGPPGAQRSVAPAGFASPLLSQAGQTPPLGVVTTPTASTTPVHQSRNGGPVAVVDVAGLRVSCRVVSAMVRQIAKALKHEKGHGVGDGYVRVETCVKLVAPVAEFAQVHVGVLQRFGGVRDVRGV